MNMSQVMEKYMEQVNKLAALSDRIKLVPLNKLAKVVEVIESDVEHWPDDEFMKQLTTHESGGYFLGIKSGGKIHEKSDLMLFTKGICRGYLLDNVFSSWNNVCDEENYYILDLFYKTKTDKFKLVLLKFPKVFSVGKNEGKEFNEQYFKILENLFDTFKECDDTDEIPLDIPVVSIPIEDISLCERLFKDYYDPNFLNRLEKLYCYFNKFELNRFNKVLAMKSGIQRGIKLLSVFFVEDLNEELVACQNKVFSKIETAMGTPSEKNKSEKIPEELNLLFCLQSIFKKLGIKNGFEHMEGMSRIDATKYINSILPADPDEVMAILIKNCNPKQIKNWPSPELIKLFPLYQIPAKAGEDASTFYRYLNVLLLESAYAYSPVLEEKVLPEIDIYGREDGGLNNCVRLAVNNIQDLFEVFDNSRGIIPQKLYIPTEDNEIKYMAALIFPFCNIELSFAEPGEVATEGKVHHLVYCALSKDRETISRCLFADIDRMEQYSRPGLMVLPRSFTYDDFFAPLWKRIVKTGRVAKIKDYTDRIVIVISDELQENVTLQSINPVDPVPPVPYREIAEFSCLEPAHYPFVAFGWDITTCSFSTVSELSQFDSRQPIESFWWEKKTSTETDGNIIGDRIEVIEDKDIPLLDTLLIQSIDYSKKGSDDATRFVVAAATATGEQTVLLCCYQLLPDYLAMVLAKYKNMIFWGTAPGKAGNAERIRRIKQIRIPDISLKEQLRELFPAGSDSVDIDDAIAMRLKFDEAARRFIAEKISAETIDLMANGITSLEKDTEKKFTPSLVTPKNAQEYIGDKFMYNIPRYKLDSFKEEVLIELKHYLASALPSLRWESLNRIKNNIEECKSDNPLLKALISKLAEYTDCQIAEINKDAGITMTTEEHDIRHALAKLDAATLYEKERQIDAEKARAEERKKVIADMSHHIKNLVMSVIDPLELLREDDQEHQVVIDSAIRGAELIREIINAMNLSFSGSTDGVIYDFNHPSHDSLKLRDILISGLKNAVSNMFDGKYFSQFRHEYFPGRERYIDAKQQWQSLDITRLDEIEALLGQFFFKFDLKLTNADIPVGNQNSTATKLLIMFQEIMLNAVKYTSFIPQAEREILVNLTVDGSRIMLEVENTFNPKSTVKSSGLGQVIIKNFAALLGAKVDFDIKAGRYKITIAFDFNPEAAKANAIL